MSRAQRFLPVIRVLAAALLLTFTARIGTAAIGDAVTVAGGPGSGPATSVALGGVRAVDGTKIYLLTGNFDFAAVHVVDTTTGIATPFAGTGVVDSGGDGLPAPFASLNDPNSLALEPSGSVLIAEPGVGVGHRGRIRRVDALTGIIHTIAGDLFVPKFLIRRSPAPYMARPLRWVRIGSNRRLRALG